MKDAALFHGNSCLSDHPLSATATLTSALLQQHSADGARNSPSGRLRHHSVKRDDHGEVLCVEEGQHLSLDMYGPRSRGETSATRNSNLFVLAIAIVGG
jgi:hypothetical protein